MLTIETHFKLGEILWIHLDEIHRLEFLFGHLHPRRLVDASKSRNGLLLVVDHFVMLSHVVRIRMGDSNVVGKFCGPEDLVFPPASSRLQETFGRISPGLR